MTKEKDLESITLILSIASKYIIVSALLILVGAAICVYAIITNLVYGSSITFTGSAVFLVLFLGLAFIVTGVFLTLRSIYWMRSEGIKLRAILEKGDKGAKGGKDNASKKENISSKKKDKEFGEEGSV